jgi:predicted flap endonuclease-1-like 5' DNA nuclease
MWCYLIPLLVGLLSAWLGYMMGKNSSSGSISSSSNADLDNCLKRNGDLSAEIERLKMRNSDLDAELSKLKASNTNVQSFAGVPPTSSVDDSTAIAFNAGDAQAVMGKKIKEDDLKVVEGIGPKIEELFNTSGILTWKALSESSVDRLREILMKAGERYQIHDPSTWPRQAKLAYEGKWHELKEWQENLDGGRES